MLFPDTFFRTLVAAAALPCIGIAREPLVKISPFLPPSNAEVPAQDHTALQYVGWVDDHGNRWYRLVDTAQKKGVFLLVGERDPDLNVVLKKLDPAHDSIVVEHLGQTLTLMARQPKVLPGAALHTLASAPPVASASPASSGQGPAKALSVLAAEVAAARARREQAQASPTAAK